MPTTTINLTGQALSKVDDTNVTLTLGGTPLTALLKATSLTLGWSGTLADARITSAATWNAKESALTFGTGLTRTVNAITIDSTVVTLTGAQALSNKTGLISQWTNDSGYLTSLSGAVTSVSGTLNRISSTGGATPVIDIDAAYVGQNSITTLGTIGTGVWQGTVIGKAYGGTGVNIATTALTLGTASSAAGSIVFQNATNANTVTVVSGVTSASYSLTLPTAQGGASTVLTNNGAGVLSWASASSGITVGTTTITSGTSTRVPFNDGGLYGEDADFTWDKTNNLLNIGASGGTATTNGLNLGGAKFLRLGVAEAGFSIGPSATIGTYGSIAMGQATASNYGLAIGGNTSSGTNVAGRNSVAIGNSQYNITYASGTHAVSIGGGAYSTFNTTVCIGFLATATAANQGVLGSNDANGYVSNWYFNGVTHTAPYSVTLNASGGSGSNVAGANLTLASGKATGNAAAGYIAFQTSTVGSSGSTLQTNAERFRISTARVTASVPIGFKAYTVATLPAGTVGDTAYVTDATAPTYLGALVGGGAVTCLVFYNGAAWVSC